jgi:hypothetical protein
LRARAGRPRPIAQRHPPSGSGGHRQIAVKNNETKLLVLAPLPLRNVVTADALHAQQHMPAYVETKKADYLFIAKDNQPTLRQDIADLDLTAFPPSPHYHR